MNPLDPQSDALDPDLELANAYLEGELDENERSIVESSDVLTDLVGALRLASDAVSQPVPVPGAARTSALAAATAAFASSPDQAAFAATTRSDATVHVIDARRRRQYRWFGGAAAAAVVVAVVVAAGSLGSNDGDRQSADGPSRSSVSTSPTVSAAGAAPTELEAASAADAAQPTDTSLTMAAAPAATVAASGTQTTTGAAGVIAIETPEQLLEVEPPVPGAPGAPATTSSPTRSVPGATPRDASLTCVGADQVALALITYQGTPAVAISDRALGVRRALDAATCAVLAEINEAP